MVNNNIKTLQITILGEPNVGKSTLLNKIMGKKYSIVTRKANTTLKKNYVVLKKDDKQIIFIDTPGIKPYKRNLNRETFKEASNAALESDLILLLINLQKDNLEKIGNIINYVKKLEKDYIVVLNKIDLIKNKNFIEKVVKIKKDNPLSMIFSLSAKKELGIKELKNYIFKKYRFYKKKAISNIELSKDSFYIEEIIREKMLENIHDEIPFNLKFITDNITENKNKSITAHITIILLKSSYKPIILGKKGENIKKIGMLARQDLEKTLNKRFHLYLHLKLLKKSSPLTDGKTK